MEDMIEKGRQDTRRALLYELRLNFANGEKTKYTKEEILAKLDEIALGAD
mgnify:CR=1 FL=1